MHINIHLDAYLYFKTHVSTLNKSLIFIFPKILFVCLLLNDYLCQLH